jgi:hypothetical protein
MHHVPPHAVLAQDSAAAMSVYAAIDNIAAQLQHSLPSVVGNSKVWPGLRL